MQIAEHWYGRLFIVVTGLLLFAAMMGRQLSATAALESL